MAASPACNTIGAAMTKYGSLVQQGVSNIAEGNLQASLLNVDCMKSRKGADDGRHLISMSALLLNNNQASRFASFAVMATAWAGLSMCPVEALAMAYEGDHRNAGEAVLNTSTSVLQLSGYVGDPSMRGEFKSLEDDDLDTFMKTITIGNVPSIKPPNEGLNSPWVPKINGLKKKDGIMRGTMRCPKWTESELEMVLPDFQGRPKPFPRKQGHGYPFWPAIASSGNDDDDNHQEKVNQPEKELFLIEDKLNQPNEEALFLIQDTASTPNDGTHDPKNSPPPQQQHLPIKKLSCFTM